MIFSSHEKYPIGYVYRGIALLNPDKNEYIEGQPFLIIREATEQEWKDECIKLYGYWRSKPEIKYFYEVSTD